MANNEVYRNDDSRFNWRCSACNRQRLKILAAEKGENMNETLTRAFLFYWFYWKYAKRKNKIFGKKIKKVTLS